VLRLKLALKAGQECQPLHAHRGVRTVVEPRGVFAWETGRVICVSAGFSNPASRRRKACPGVDMHMRQRAIEVQTSIAPGSL